MVKEVILSIAIIVGFTSFLVWILISLSDSKKAAEEEHHQKYMEAISYCHSKNEDKKDLEECINMIMQPR